MTQTEARFVLGLGPTFSANDLKKAYRKAAADNHPDRGGNPERMMMVNEAFEILNGAGDGHRSYQKPEDAPFRRSAEKPPTSAEPDIAPPTQKAKGFDHPLQKYVFWVSVALAITFWISGFVNGQLETDEVVWWVILGPPFSYVITFALVRFLVGCGIHIYNFALRIRSFGKASVYSWIIFGFLIVFLWSVLSMQQSPVKNSPASTQVDTRPCYRFGLDTPAYYSCLQEKQKGIKR